MFSMFVHTGMIVPPPEGMKEHSEIQLKRSERNELFMQSIQAMHDCEAGTCSPKAHVYKFKSNPVNAMDTTKPTLHSHFPSIP